MHIEPGFINGIKVMAANGAAVGILLLYAKNFFAKFFTTILRTILSAVFFSLFMQSFHMSVGPSELHFIGAMIIYLIFGFLPTLYGFALGLLFQGILFEPSDLPHLAVNSLSLILPLLFVHYIKGKSVLKNKINVLSWKETGKTILALDSMYYAGVTFMVGFWLLGESQTNLQDWALFALSYLPVVFLEPIFTLTAVAGLRIFKDNIIMQHFFAVENFS